MLQYNFFFQLFIMVCCTITDSSMQWKDLGSDHNNLVLFKTLNLKLLLNQFNNDTPVNSSDPENISSSTYYDIDERNA